MSDLQETAKPLELPRLPLTLGSQTAEYTSRDSLLYAISVGARHDELALVYEAQATFALPTMGAALGLSFTQTAAEALGYHRDAVLHIGQRLELHTPLPTAATFEMRGEVTRVLDKGHAAIVYIEVVSGYFTAEYVMYVPDVGGFGGERGSRMDTVPFIAEPSRVSVPVSHGAAALYRLASNDDHPVHIDPAVAQAAGHDAPILHGLCSLGMSVLAVCREAQVTPDQVRGLSATWSKPVELGDPLDVLWNEQHEGLRFESSQMGEAVCQGTIERS